MPFEVRWEQKPHIIFFKLIGKLSEDDVMAALDQAIALTNEVPESIVHTLVDASEVQRLPPLPVMSREIRRLLAESPNRGAGTVFGLSRLVRFMLEMIVKVTPLRMKLFDTRQEALSFILQMVASEEQIGQTPGERVG